MFVLLIVIFLTKHYIIQLIFCPLHTCSRFQVTDKAVFVAANDKVTVICPNKAMYTSANKSWTTELGYENMHLVDARGYHTCNATNGTLVLLCDKPEPLQYVTLGSSRGPLGFEPGATYHFIGMNNIFVIIKFRSFTLGVYIFVRLYGMIS